MNKKEKAIMKTTKIPNFKTEEEERVFWETNDSDEYLDWSKAKSVRFPNLKKAPKQYHCDYQKICSKL